MPVRKRADKEELLEQVPLTPRKPRQQADPTASLPVGTITGEASPMPAPKTERRNAEDISTRYARALVAYNGDIAKALAKTFNIPEDEAAMNMVELHDRARGASRVNSNMVDMMERHDLTIEVRLAKLREHQFSPVPAVSLKAIEAISELDASAKSRRTGTTWEAFVSRVRQGAGPKAQQAKLAPKTKP